MTWYEKLKFRYNPLDVRPNTKLIGLEREEKKLSSHIKKGEICFLNGLTGSGKTSLLMKLQKEMKGFKFVYLDAHDLPTDFNLRGEIKKKRSFFDKLFLRNSPKKKPVLIIDEFQATDPNLVLQARAKWENPRNKKIKAIVISQISKHLKNVAPSFLERLGSRVIKLGTLDEDEMKQIIYRRLYKTKKINYAEKFSDDALTFLIRCSGGNPRRLLEYTDEIFDFHHRKFGIHNPILVDNYTITYHGTKEILGLEKVHVDGFSHLDESQEIIKDSMKKGIDTFQQLYNPTEQKILRYLKASPKTIDQVASRFKVAKGTASRYLNKLKKKNAVLFAGKIKKNNKKRWQIEPGTKRLMVKV
jgi:hypothetical protein